MVRSSLFIIVVSVATAHADPASTPVSPPAVTLQPVLVWSDPAPLPTVVSLRLEAARAAAEVFENSWRYPDTSPVFSLDGGHWFMGPGGYTPRSRRAAALHGASTAATFVGQILLAVDSPLAGIGAMITGATLDAAAADADRDAEARR